MKSPFPWKWYLAESAPKDGRPILSYHPYDWASPNHKPEFAIIRWDESSKKWLYTLPGNYIQYVEIEFTHWLPVPELPDDGDG